MDRINNILVIVDPTATEHPAIEKGARLAEKAGARVELFACETKQSRAMRYAAHLARGGAVDFVAHMRPVLEDLARPLRQRGLDTSVEAATGDPLHVQLLERTQRTGVDLVIKDTHHHSLAKRTFITNTDWHLVRGCPVPLLLTKARPWTATPTIAAAVDPGHVNDKPVVLDNRILDSAEYLRRTFGGALHALHAFLPLVLVAEAASGVPAMVTPLTHEMLEEERAAQFERLRSLAAPYGIDPQQTHVRLGVATEIIREFVAEAKVEILVMGAISRSGLQRIFIGSTAEQVLETLDCDLLVVKSPDFAATLPF